MDTERKVSARSRGPWEHALLCVSASGEEPGSWEYCGEIPFVSLLGRAPPAFGPEARASPTLSPTFTRSDRSLPCLSCAQSPQGPEPPCHAESLLLELIQSWSLDPQRQYRLTCFLSWSPCGDCAQEVAQFLRRHSHVSLSLFTSRVYTRGCYAEGLRALKRAGARIAVMSARGQRGPGGGGPARCHQARGSRVTCRG